jgi:hypothetical protein
VIQPERPFSLAMVPRLDRAKVSGAGAVSEGGTVLGILTEGAADETKARDSRSCAVTSAATA